MHVCGTCSSRDPQSKYEVKELTTLAPTHWVRVPEGSLQLLKSEPLIKLLRVPTKTADASATIHEDEDEEEQHVEVEVRRHEFHNFWEHEGKAYHIVPEAVFVDEKTERPSICVCGYCAKHWDSARAIQLLRRWGDASGNSSSETYKESDASGDGTFDTSDDLYYEARKNGAPVSAIAAGADYHQTLRAAASAF